VQRNLKSLVSLKQIWRDTCDSVHSDWKGRQREGDTVRLEKKTEKGAFLKYMPLHPLLFLYGTEP